MPNKYHQSQSSIVYALRCGNFLLHRRRIGEKNLDHCHECTSFEAEIVLDKVIGNLTDFVKLKTGHVINTEWVLAVDQWHNEYSGCSIYFITGDELHVDFLTTEEAKDTFELIRIFTPEMRIINSTLAVVRKQIKKVHYINKKLKIETGNGVEKTFCFLNEEAAHAAYGLLAE